MVVSYSSLVGDLRDLGLKNGDHVLVNSSLSSLGHVQGGADTVIDALLDVIGRSGTLLMPTLTGSFGFHVPKPLIFNVDNTPTCSGPIAETFRRRPGVRRSHHPTHSVAAQGELAYELLRDHEFSYHPCADDTPFLRLRRFSGKVLFLGVGLERSMVMHGVEEMAEVDYHMRSKAVEAIVIKGEAKYTVNIGLHRPGIPRRFDRIEPLLYRQGAICRGKIGNALSKLISVEPMVQIAWEKLKEDPYYFVEEKDRELVI